MSTPVRGTGAQRDNYQVNPPKGYRLLEGGMVMEIKKINPHPGHLLRMMGEEVEMVMMVVVEMMMTMVMMRMMRKTELVTESEEVEEQAAPSGRGVSAGAGGGGDEPAPVPGVGNIGPRGR